MLIRRSAAAMAALALTFSLTACGNQSVAEACEVANSEAEAALEKFQAINPSDPAAAAKQVQEMASELNKIADGLKNDEVQESLSDIAGSFEKIEDALGELDAAGEGTDAMQETVEKFTEIGTEMNEQRAAFNELCG